jgi:hypothetical protein
MIEMTENQAKREIRLREIRDNVAEKLGDPDAIDYFEIAERAYENLHHF